MSPRTQYIQGSDAQHSNRHVSSYFTTDIIPAQGFHALFFMIRAYDSALMIRQILKTAQHESIFLHFLGPMSAKSQPQSLSDGR